MGHIKRIYQKVNYNKEEPISIRLMRDGEILKQNMFVTVKGNYKISIILYEGCIYFVKELGGKICEAVNMTENARKVEKE